MENDIFQYGFSGNGLVDIGRKSSSNQDEIILAPEYGFFAVSDGMGGLIGGGKTSEMIRQVLPGLIREAAAELKKNLSPAYAAALLAEHVRMLSDSVYDTGNKHGSFDFGATLSGVWLVNKHAVFINLGDSRGYLLSHTEKNIRQITRDHSLSALLIERNELTKEEARRHSSRSQLRRFVGMNAPAAPETFIQELSPGDKLLLCSDGLHGMVNDDIFSQIMRSSQSSEVVLKQLIDAANENGGDDNISALYIKIFRKNSGENTV